MIIMGERGLSTLLIEVQIDIDTRENTTIAASEANEVSPCDQAVFFLDTHFQEESYHLLWFWCSMVKAVLQKQG